MPLGKLGQGCTFVAPFHLKREEKQFEKAKQNSMMFNIYCLEEIEEDHLFIIIMPFEPFARGEDPPTRPDLDRPSLPLAEHIHPVKQGVLASLPPTAQSGFEQSLGFPAIKRHRHRLPVVYAQQVTCVATAFALRDLILDDNDTRRKGDHPLWGGGTADNDLRVVHSQGSDGNDPRFDPTTFMLTTMHAYKHFHAVTRQ
jgi:hypothetical protein